VETWWRWGDPAVRGEEPPPRTASVGNLSLVQAPLHLVRPPMLWVVFEAGERGAGGGRDPNERGATDAASASVSWAWLEG
jgi:hypothetical protein